MRRTVMRLMLVVGLLGLAGCGNKGPLVRAPAQPAATPATAVSQTATRAATPVSAPAVATSTGVRY